MAQTQRTVSSIWTLLANNTAAAISPTDLRDALETWRPRWGQLTIPNGSGSATTISTGGTYVEATQGTWGVVGSGYEFDESDGNGRLTYTGTQDVIAQITCAFSLTGNQNNAQLRARLGINGTTNANTESVNTLASSGRFRSGVCQLITTLSTGDHVSLWVTYASATGTITVQTANLLATTWPA